jgi:hypothetical protein
MTLSVPAIIGITGWFILGGIDLAVGGFKVSIALRSGLEYAAAITPWLAYLRTRGMVGTAGAPATETTSVTTPAGAVVSSTKTPPDAPAGTAKE